MFLEDRAGVGFMSGVGCAKSNSYETEIKLSLSLHLGLVEVLKSLLRFV